MLQCSFLVYPGRLGYPSPLHGEMERSTRHFRKRSTILNRKIDLGLISTNYVIKPITIRQHFELGKLAAYQHVYRHCIRYCSNGYNF